MRETIDKAAERIGTLSVELAELAERLTGAAAATVARVVRSLDDAGDALGEVYHLIGQPGTERPPRPKLPTVRLDVPMITTPCAAWPARLRPPLLPPVRRPKLPPRVKLELLAAGGDKPAVTIAEPVRRRRRPRPRGSMLPIYLAAREVGRSKVYVRDLVERGLVTAYRRGGPERCPWLEVDLGELRAAICGQSVYVPEAARTAPAKLRRRQAGASKGKASSWVDLMRK